MTAAAPRIEALDLMYYTDGYKYQIRTQLRFRLPADFAPYSVDTAFISLSSCILTIKPGYAYDGASGWTIDTKNSMRPAAFHDACYALMREGYLPRSMKLLVDDLFYELLRQDGMSKARASIWHKGLEVGGTPATIHNKNVLVAP